MKYDIITFGSATRDIFFKSKALKVKGETKLVTGIGLCLALGSKIDVDEIYFSTGGGGTNVAVTFVKQGLKTAFCGMVGKDFAADKILEKLKKIGVDTSLVVKTDKKSTNYSVILASDGKDRTILVYRGAAGELSRKDIPWSKIKGAKWLYLAPLSGKLARLTGALVDFAKENKIKVAMNPGTSQLSLPKAELNKILKKVDVLILNQEEASVLVNVSFKREKEIFNRLNRMVSGIWVVTQGARGAVASDGEYLYQASALQGKVVDKTGAGDAFASGFLANLIKTNSIISAVQLGIANSVSCLSEYGAKEGLLEGKGFKKVKVKKVDAKES